MDLACPFSSSWSRFPWTRAVSQVARKQVVPINATSWTLRLAGHTPPYLSIGFADKSVPEHATTFSPQTPGHASFIFPCHLQTHKSRDLRSGTNRQVAGIRALSPAQTPAGAQVRSSLPPSLGDTRICTHTGDHTHPSPCSSTSTRFPVFPSTQKLSFSQPCTRERSSLAGAWRSAAAPGLSASLAGSYLCLWRLRAEAWALREVAWPADHRRPAADWCSGRGWPRERAGGCAASTGPGGWQPLGTFPHAPLP